MPRVYNAGPRAVSWCCPQVHCGLQRSRGSRGPPATCEPLHSAARIKVVHWASFTSGGCAAWWMEAAAIEPAAPTGTVLYFFFTAAPGTGKPRLRASASMPASLPRKAR